MKQPPLWAPAVATTLDGLLRPGGLSLICAERAAGRALLFLLAGALALQPASVTELALSPEAASSERDLLARLDGHSLLYDVQTLCWSPWLQLDPVRLLRQHARRHGVVAVWPGSVIGRSVSFSSPGRRDHFSSESRDITVLRPTPTRFPDEIPFTIERTSA